MRSRILPLFILLSFFIKPAESIAQVNTQDSLALVDFYNSTNGPNWSFVQWDLNTPVSTWSGVGTQQNRVVSMKLWGACRGGKILPSFGNLTALTRIEFLDCTLTDATLPEEFSKLTNLTYLYMHAVFYYLPFPAVITKMPNLNVIDFEDNYFTDTIPASIGNITNLTYLDLSNSFFPNGSKIPIEIGNLKKLQTLILASAHLIDTIPSSFGNLESLTSLAISDNQLRGNIPPSLNHLKGLDFISFENNQYTFGGIEPFINEANSTGKMYSVLGVSPQANIKVTRHHHKIAVSAGGTLSNNTYKWYKDGPNLVATVNGDSAYQPNYLGNYYVEVTNSVVPDLTLYSDTINFKYLIEERNTVVLVNISGLEMNEINDSFFRIASMKPFPGPDGLNGNVTAGVTIDPTVSTVNGQPYVQRHYDFRPRQNAENAEAIIVLYFTQQEFDNYNNYIVSNGLSYPLLPTAGVDNGNARISQFHGPFTDSPDPKNYGSDRIMITPFVQWDTINKWWTVTFPVKGFGGSFLTTGNFVLPLSLIKFNGSLNQGSVALEWFTENETGSQEFVVEKSNDGNKFNDIGSVAAQFKSERNTYHFEDANPFSGNNYYRLRMIDKDGQFSYSPIIMINFGEFSSQLTIYPNPAKANLNLKFNLDKRETINLQITDASGRIVEKRTVSANNGITTTSINIEKLSKGIYFLEFEINGIKKRSSFLKN